MNSASHRARYIVAAVFVVIAMNTAITSQTAHAAACTPPGTDYGTVSYTASVGTAGTYRIWLRMAAPDVSTNTVLLDIDSTTCYIAGGSSVPVYANGTSTYFTNNTSNWINKTSSNAVISYSFTSGSHTIKLIGNGTGVVVDRVIMTTDDTCTPTATGDNCVMVYLAPDIDMNGVVNFLDFSALANKYGQSGGSIGRSDINRDGTVDFLDFSLLASKYGQ
jgi:hypothetical protein